MNVSLRQLRLFHAVALTGSITAAAREQHVTQPSVSMQLKQLADSVGMPLYEIVGRKIRLTEAGEILAGTCEDMFARWDDFEMTVAALRGLQRGRLRIAVVSTATYFIPRLLGPFAAKYPGIEISLEVANRDRVVARLAQSLDDLVIMTTPPTNIPLLIEPLLDNPLVLIAQPKHVLVGKKRIRRERLANERFILREPGSGTRISCDRQFAKWGFNPKVQMELGGNEAIKEAVAGGFGLAVISRHALNRHPARDDLAILDIVGFPISSRWYLVRRAEKRVTPVALAFLAFLRKSLAA